LPQDRELGAGAESAGTSRTGRDGPGTWPQKVRELCHGINNHLGVITGHVELMTSAGGRHLPPDVIRRLRQIDEAAERIRALVGQAAAESRSAPAEREA